MARTWVASPLHQDRRDGDLDISTALGAHGSVPPAPGISVTFPALKEQWGDLLCCFCEWYLKPLFITLTQFTL